MDTAPLPSYLMSAKPNPMAGRAPWYKTIAPSYAGIFLWIAFYDQLGTALPVGGLAGALLGLVVAGVLGHLLFYKVFAMMGMQTGLPLYVVGSSTFGTTGGLLFPGVFMGLLQIGWYSVATFFAAKMVLEGFGYEARTLYTDGEFNLLFVGAAIVWGYVFATIGAFGVQYVAKVSQFFPIIPLAMLLIAAVGALSGLGAFDPTATTVAAAATTQAAATQTAAAAEPVSLSTLAGMGLIIQLVIGFFATAGAAGCDFGTAARDAGDVEKGGWVGVALAIIVAGGLAVLTVAGAHGLNPGLTAWNFGSKDVLATVSPKLAGMMLILFAIGSMAPACFCASIIGNSLSTMIPSLPRVPLTLAGATIGILLAATGVAGNLGGFFGIIGSSFGPICGAMVADYILSGRRWAGPREGISIAGYGAWLVGFIVGISNNLGWVASYHPTAVYSFVVGFVVYVILAGIGLQGRPVAMPYAVGGKPGDETLTSGPVNDPPSNKLGK